MCEYQLYCTPKWPNFHAVILAFSVNNWHRWIRSTCQAFQISPAVGAAEGMRGMLVAARSLSGVRKRRANMIC